MAASSILRADDSTGTAIKTFTDDDGRHAQATVPSVLDGSDNPVPVSGDNPVPSQVYDGTGAIGPGNPLDVDLRDAAGNSVGTVDNPINVATVSAAEFAIIERWGINLDVDSASGPETIGTRFGQSGGPPAQFPWPANGLAIPDNYEVTGGTSGARVTIRTVLADLSIISQTVELTGGTVTADVDGGPLLGTPIQAFVSGATPIASEVQIRKPSGGTIYMVIETAIQQTETVTEAIPAGAVGYVKKVEMITTGDAFVQVVAREPGGVARVRFQARLDANRQRVFFLGIDSFPRSGIGPLPAGTWVEVRCDSVGSNNDVTARMTILTDTNGS